MARVEILSAQLEEGEAASSSPPATPLSAPHAALATSHASPPPTSPPPHASPPLPLQQAPLEGTLSVPWRGRGRRQRGGGRPLAPRPLAPRPLAPPALAPSQLLPQQQTEPLPCSEADTVPEPDAPEQLLLLQALLVAEPGPEQQRLLEALHCLSSRVHTDAELSMYLGSPACVARLLLFASDAELMSGGDQVRLLTALVTMTLLYYGYS